MRPGNFYNLGDFLRKFDQNNNFKAQNSPGLCLFIDLLTKKHLRITFFYNLIIYNLKPTQGPTIAHAQSGKIASRRFSI
jgi:hypothetical protein